MLNTPYQIAIACRELDVPLHSNVPQPARWTWIAGRRYRSIKRS